MTNKSYKAAGHVAWRRVDDEVVVLDLDSSAYYSLNDTGSRMWELLAAGHPLDKVVSLVADEYGHASADVSRDADALLKELLREKLVVPAS